MNSYIYPGLDQKIPRTPAQKAGKLLNVICDFFEIDPYSLSSRSKITDLVIPRHIFCYMVLEYIIDRKSKRKTFNETDAALMVGRDRTNIYNSHKVISEMLFTKQLKYETIERLRYLARL